ncbi:MAG TPA: hypothetical protein VF573_03935 [Paraburkholderia sp.]|uniref:hypothetical protein n=1 Tax=Paraburkholderia sp. TaxID=1926495 RepID=UPI002ED34EAB
MPDLIETQTTETIEPQAPEPAELSIADHAAQFSPEAQRAAAEPVETQEPAQATATPTAATPEKRERHRAKSQQARSDDVPRINELTRKLREAEAELTRLRQPATTSQPAAQEPPTRVEAKSSTTGFTEKEPVVDDFLNEADPYAAWMRAVNRYDRKKEQWERDQQTASQREQESEQAKATAFQSRVETFRQKTPDWTTVVSQSPVVSIELTPLLKAALIDDDNGPAFMYYLAQHPDVFDDLMLATDGREPSASSVATLRRRLSSQLTRTQAAATGSAAAMSSTSWTARPPNPVRTSPTTTGNHEPPGDGHSLAEHAKHYGPKRR